MHLTIEGLDYQVAQQPRIGGGPPQAAVLSRDGRYRYALTRIWDPDAATVVFIMLNPSTADALTDDPTIRRCQGFARHWGAGGLLALNRFALRATDPRALKTATDPVGPANDSAITQLLSQQSETGGPVVAAWGNHGSLLGRAATVTVTVTGLGVRLWSLGCTGSGQPRHPLYLPADAPLIAFPEERP